MALPEEHLRPADAPLAPPRSIRPPHLPYPASDLLRFSTAGSVDDGKSTLIGRLLHDSKGIFEDQLAALEAATRRRGGDGLDLALLTDGLRAEREQGITIDVAYRSFVTPTRGTRHRCAGRHPARSRPSPSC